MNKAFEIGIQNFLADLVGVRGLARNTVESYRFDLVSAAEFFLAGGYRSWAELTRDDLIDYLERIPDGYISKRQELIDKYTQPAMPEMAPEEMAGVEEGSPMPPRGGGQLVDTGAQTPLPTGRGYSELQRKVNQTGLTE